MDHDGSDRNAKRVLNHSQEEQKENRNAPKKAKSLELPAHLKPKFARKHRKKREKSMSKESSKEEEPTGDKEGKGEREREKERDEDDRQPSIDKAEEEEPEVRESEKETGTTGTVGTTGTIGISGTMPVEMEQPSGERKKRTSGEDAKKGNAVAQFVDETADVPAKNDPPKKTNDFWDEGEKKRKEELKIRIKEASGRTKKNKKSDRSPRKKHGGASGRKHNSKRNKKKKDVSVNTPPPPSPTPSQAQKAEKSCDQGHGNQGSRRAPPKKPKTPDAQKLDKTTKKTGKKPGFFKSILDKTKFWSTRKSDCGLVATKEFLSKSYVPPEYDQSNPLDFEPPPASFLSEEQLHSSKTNLCASEEAIFLNKRPFWLTRGTAPEDVIPKPQLHVMHRMSNANLKTVAEPVKRVPFMDPKTCSLKDLMGVDQAIGLQPGKAADEAKCVAQNTFAGTILLQSYKSSKEAKRKLKEMETRLSQRTVKEKSASREEGEKSKAVSFSNVPRAVDKEPIPVTLNRYLRKERPLPPASRIFTQEVYFVGLARKPSKRGHVDATSDSSSRK